jgi:hypothetical protein
MDSKLVKKSATIRRSGGGVIVSTLAGSGDWGYADGSGAEAQFDFPLCVAADAAGNVYIADRDNCCARKIRSNI